MKTYTDKVAAISGAGSGIGRALARQLAAAGCHLALCDIDAAGLAETARLAARLAARPGLRITTQAVDVGDRDAIYAWAAAVVRDHGRVNLIFNNAGVSLAATVAGMRDEDLQWIFDINFWGVVHGTRAFLPHLQASGDGHVVNTSSLFGLLAVPGASAYNASKFAVRGFTEALRQELELGAQPVSATSVHPGGIKTNIVRSGRRDASLRDIGLDATQSAEDFEKLFITTPERAARIILRGVRRNRRRVLVGPDAVFFDLLVRLLPASYQRISVALQRRRARSIAATAAAAGSATADERPHV